MDTTNLNCGNCIHFGTLRKKTNQEEGICMAPITTDPPPNGETRAKHPFVYPTHKDGLCELHTPFPNKTHKVAKNITLKQKQGRATRTTPK